MKALAKKAIRTLYTALSYNANLNEKWKGMKYILTSNNFHKDFLAKHKHLTEVEHQIGRYLNMKQIFIALDFHGNSAIKGDIVEFGTWQGLGLIYFSRLLGVNINNRKLIGIDSFEGLPHSSTIWNKGHFANTGTDLVINNFNHYADLKFKRENVSLIKGWFNDPKVKKQLLNQVKQVALVHFDADLGTSTTEALELIEHYLIDRKEPIYFLFDDWGCHPDEVPDAFLGWLEQFRKKQFITIEKISSTRFTRYYKLNFS